MNSEKSAPIRPEIIAAKLVAVREIKSPDLTEQFQTTPRLAELLWFLQAMSTRPGGLSAFVKNLVAQNAARIGTKTMRAIAGKKTPWNLAERQAVCDEMPRSSSHDRIEFIDSFWHSRLYGPPAPEAERKSLIGYDREYFCNGFKQTASEDLPARLARFCNEAETTLDAPAWFPDLIPALVDAMDAHAAAAAKNIVMTTVALKVFDALDYAVKTRAFVHIQGESRFGKTEAIKCWCEMHHGKVRLVRTPSSNSMADFYKAMAEALGIQFSFGQSPRGIKEKVEYVIRHGGLAFVLDESQFLYPQNYNADTCPARLNWLRTEVIDRRCAVVLVSTPQSYTQHRAKFVKKTGYNIEQFVGRKMLDITLPDSLEQDDLLAVAKFHFPALDPLDLELIVAKSMQSESYLLTVEAIAQRAAYIAERDGHAAVTLEDVDLAISEVIPGQAATPAVTAAAPAPAANPIVERRPRPIRATRPARPSAAPALAIPARQTTPETLSQA